MCKKVMKKMGLRSYSPFQSTFVTLAAGIIVVCCCYFVIYFSAFTWLLKSEPSELKRGALFDKNTSKTILLWNSFFTSKHFGFGIGHEPFIRAKCPVSNCFIVDRSDGYLPIPVEEYDIVVFHMGESSAIDPPRQRRVHQRYVYFNLESPVNTKITYKTDLYKPNYFNWTMTYRRSSDIFFPYGWVTHISDARKVLVIPEKSAQKWITPNYSLSTADPSLETLLQMKNKLIAWFVSNCNSQSERYRYVEALLKFVPVDIYGRCGNLKCSRGSSNCDEMLDTTYKFYLSFENSLCVDYVTEKMFRTLKHYVVPIVYGGSNYSMVAPPNSYIDVSAFASQKELADYLLYLDKNPQEYKKYFWWKYFYTTMDNHKYILCELCQMVNNVSVPSKTYKDINKWWSDNTCHNPPETQ